MDRSPLSARAVLVGLLLPGVWPLSQKLCLVSTATAPTRPPAAGVGLVSVPPLPQMVIAESPLFRSWATSA